MLNRISDSVVRHPWFYIVAFILVTAFFGWQMPDIEVDATVKQMLPEDLPARKNLDRIESLFGGTDMMIIVLSTDDVLRKETVKRVKEITNRMERVKEFDEIVSMFTIMDIQSEGGELIIQPLVSMVPETREQREKLRQKLRQNEYVYGTVISRDFKHVAIAGFQNIQATDEDVLKHVRSIVEQVPGSERVILGGSPYSREMLGRDIKGDLTRFVPYGFLVTLIFLFICFRQLRGVLLPTSVMLMSIIVAMGLIPLLGWKIQMVTIILPVFMIAVANNYGIHVVSRYQEDNLVGTDRTPRDLAGMGINALTAPILLTGITTIAGVLCLNAHVIVSARQMGILAACGVVFALFGSLLFIPAVLSIIPKAKSIYSHAGSRDVRDSLLHRLLTWTARWTIKHPRAILISTLVLIVPIAYGIGFLVVENSPVSYYSADSPVVVSSNLVDEHFGGSLVISAVAEGDIKSPKVMKKIDEMTQYMESHPKVEMAMSIAKIIRQINEVMNNNNRDFYKIPDERPEIAQYLLAYSMGADPSELDKLVDFPYQHAHIFTRVKGNKSVISSNVLEYLQEYIRTNKDAPISTIGGFGEMVSELTDLVIRGQVVSLALAMVFVGMLVMLLFRSFVAGLVTLIPLGLAMLFLFGLMGYTGIELNIATAMLSSIMIGVGVDYTIHFLWRYRIERFMGLQPDEAVCTVLTTSGRGIVFNAVSVMVGFAVLIVSTFLPVRFFGILVVVCISACLFGALVVLPVVCLLFQPRFLQPKGDL